MTPGVGWSGAAWLRVTLLWRIASQVLVAALLWSLPRMNGCSAVAYFVLLHVAYCGLWLRWRWRRRWRRTLVVRTGTFPELVYRISLRTRSMMWMSGMRMSVMRRRWRRWRMCPCVCCDCAGCHHDGEDACRNECLKFMSHYLYSLIVVNRICKDMRFPFAFQILFDLFGYFSVNICYLTPTTTSLSPSMLMLRFTFASMVLDFMMSAMSTPVTDFTTSKVCFMTVGTFCDTPDISPPVVP